MVFGSKPANFFGREDTDEGLAFARDSSSSGKFAQQWKLRMMAQEPALGAMANSRLRRLSARYKSVACADVKIGDAVRIYNAPSTESAPRWRVPALILGIDETGVLAKFQSQTFSAARFCVMGKGEEQDVGDAELVPPQARFRLLGADLEGQLRRVDVGKDMEAGRGNGNPILSTGTPESGSGRRSEMIPVPDSPPPSVQLPSPRAPLDGLYHLESAFDEKCAPS